MKKKVYLFFFVILYFTCNISLCSQILYIVLIPCSEESNNIPKNRPPLDQLLNAFGFKEESPMIPVKAIYEQVTYCQKVVKLETVNWTEKIPSDIHFQLDARSRKSRPTCKIKNIGINQFYFPHMLPASFVLSSIRNGGHCSPFIFSPELPEKKLTDLRIICSIKDENNILQQYFSPQEITQSNSNDEGKNNGNDNLEKQSRGKIWLLIVALGIFASLYTLYKFNFFTSFNQCT